jgi:hypothetical protein
VRGAFHRSAHWKAAAKLRSFPSGNHTTGVIAVFQTSRSNPVGLMKNVSADFSSINVVAATFCKQAKNG